MKSLVFISLFFLSIVSSVLAHDKVVIVPLNTGSKFASEFVYGGGYFNNNGDLITRFGKPFTYTRTGVGQYEILFPNLRPDCKGKFPIPYITSVSGNSVNLFPPITFCDSGDMNLRLQIINSIGESVDDIIYIQIMLGEDFVAE